MSKELIRLSNCTMKFEDEVVLDNLNLYINDQEFLTLLGPSGCGKTTTLRIIGGFQTPTSGDVFFDGVRMNSVPPHKRAINTVFQKYALFPHLNVYENVAFGLRIPKVEEQKDENGKVISRRKVKLSEKEIDQRVLEMLEIVNLKGFETRRITQLSGVQQQRVAIARALVNNPSMIIADEPTGNLDPQRSLEIMVLLERINELGTTVLVVTHEKALVNRFAKRVVAIENGRIISDETGGYYNGEKV